MAFPDRNRIKIVLLYLIYEKGGEVKPSETFDVLAKIFKLSKEEREETLSRGENKWENKILWAKKDLCIEGLLNCPKRGIWKITEKGKEIAKQIDIENDLFVEQIIKEVFPNVLKQFPDDFLENDHIVFFELDVPGTELFIESYKNTLVVSENHHFVYPAKNPSEAKYIVYANQLGQKKIKIPTDNRQTFVAVSEYEKYVKTVLKECYDKLITKTKSEEQANIILKKLKKRFFGKINSF